MTIFICNLAPPGKKDYVPTYLCPPARPIARYASSTSSTVNIGLQVKDHPTCAPTRYETLIITHSLTLCQYHILSSKKVSAQSLYILPRHKAPSFIRSLC
ncbi:hypothetical protein DL93DRAFT_2092318 [Clavulina sp. PMI_390]|nr:hypothetical protein DL93DRAFT_2092318 [Clavulina sp. PMI_390]